MKRWSLFSNSVRKLSGTCLPFHLSRDASISNELTEQDGKKPGVDTQNYYRLFVYSKMEKKHERFLLLL